MHPRDTAMLFIEGNIMPFIQEASGLTYGTNEGELIFGSDSSLVRARGGNDGLRLGDYSDIAHLGDGNDVAYSGDGSDAILGENGDDLIHGGAGSDWLVGGEGNDQLLGGPGDDILVAIFGDKSGDNTLYGDTGDDMLHGGSGQDVIFGGEGDDIIFAGADDDWLQGGTGADQIQGERGDDVIFGSADEDGQPTDGSSAEIFYIGGDDNDEINGFAAVNDQIIVSADINDTGIESLADLADRVTDADNGAAIDLGEQTQILITGVAADDVNANMADYFTIA
jgi:Ca2+-binding RTX toxin-like protein